VLRPPSLKLSASISTALVAIKSLFLYLCPPHPSEVNLHRHPLYYKERKEERKKESGNSKLSSETSDTLLAGLQLLNQHFSNLASLGPTAYRRDSQLSLHCGTRALLDQHWPSQTLSSRGCLFTPHISVVNNITGFDHRASLIDHNNIRYNTSARPWNS